MIYQQQLRIPGPTPLPERVVRAAGRPMIDHRGPEFAELLADVTAGARRVLETSAYGARVVQLEAEWGQPVDPADLARVLADHPRARVVLLTHNETSTGVTNGLAGLVRVAH